MYFVLEKERALEGIEQSPVAKMGPHSPGLLASQRPEHKDVIPSSIKVVTMIFLLFVEVMFFVFPNFSRGGFNE